LPLKKGRLLGCSAYEETLDENPYATNHPEVPFSKKGQLSLSKYLTGSQKFYNHAFAILDVAPDKITASYYEYPSWGTNNPPPGDPAVGKPLFQEQIAQLR
jgi:hypothetical protein